jgi:hypothetical protein
VTAGSPFHHQRGITRSRQGKNWPGTSSLAGSESPCPLCLCVSFFCVLCFRLVRIPATLPVQPRKLPANCRKSLSGQFSGRRARRQRFRAHDRLPALRCSYLRCEIMADFKVTQLGADLDFENLPYWDVVIIGAGPAGLAASLTTATAH